MDIGIVGGGMAGLSAAWWFRRAGHHVVVFERNYKPGGRLNSRRKAGLVVDHGQRFISSSTQALKDLIHDCGLHTDLRPIEQPILRLNGKGLADAPPETSETKRLAFADGMLVLPQALRRSVGGFYSIGVTTIERDEETRKYILRTDPPIRSADTQVDAVVVACPAPEAILISEPIHSMLDATFLQRAAAVDYTKCIVLIAALEKVRLERAFYAIETVGDEHMLSWLAFEDQKHATRSVPGWSSLVLHATPKASERLWKTKEESLLKKMYAEARRLIPQLPERYCWARSKRWDNARLKAPDNPVTISDFPAAPDDILVEFCGDYRAGDGVAHAAESGRDAADAIMRKAKARG